MDYGRWFMQLIFIMVISIIGLIFSGVLLSYVTKRQIGSQKNKEDFELIQSTLFNFLKVQYLYPFIFAIPITAILAFIDYSYAVSFGSFIFFLFLMLILIRLFAKSKLLITSGKDDLEASFITGKASG